MTYGLGLIGSHEVHINDVAACLDPFHIDAGHMFFRRKFTIVA